MAPSLTQDFDAHVPFTFARIPESPMLANRAARVRRWFTIAFAESWLAILVFRTKQRLRAAGIPLVPSACDVLARAVFGVSIGNAAEIGPGLMITHGQVVIDGRTRIGRNCQINPWVTIGLSNSRKLGFSADGPTIGDNVHIGTGAKVLGPITIGDYVRIGANTVVVNDVPPNVTVVGAPARIVGRPPGAPSDGVEGSGSDERVLGHMRHAIVDYRLGRQSLQSMVDALVGSFELASDDLRPLQASIQDDLIFLDAIAATGGDESQQVRAAVDALDRAIGARSEAKS